MRSLKFCTTSKITAACLFAILFVSPKSQAQQANPPRALAVLMKAGSANEFSPVLEYSRVELESGSAIKVVLPNFQKSSIPKADIALIFLYPDPSKILAVKADFDELTAKKKEALGLSAKFNNARPYMTRVVAQIDSDLTMMGAGQVRFRNAWITRASFDALSAKTSKPKDFASLTIGMKTYQNVELTKVENGAVSFKHEGGIAKADLAAAPPELVKKLYSRPELLNAYKPVPELTIKGVKLIGAILLSVEDGECKILHRDGFASLAITGLAEEQRGSLAGSNATIGSIALSKPAGDLRSVQTSELPSKTGDQQSKATEMVTQASKENKDAIIREQNSSDNSTNQGQVIQALTSPSPERKDDPKVQHGEKDSASNPGIATKVLATSLPVSPDASATPSQYKWIGFGLIFLIIAGGIVAGVTLRKYRSASTSNSGTSVHKFDCPTCGQRISATSDLIGTPATCPVCNHTFEIPFPLDASTPPPESLTKKRNLGTWIKLGVISSVVLAGGFLTFKYATNDSNDAVALVRKYLKTKHWQDRLQYVASPDKVKPLMERYYKEFKGPITYHGIEDLGNGPGGSKLIKAIINDRNTTYYWISETANGLKIDWEASVGYNPISAAAYKASRPTTPIRLRVIGQLKDYYNFEFTNRKKWLSINLQDKNGDLDLTGYVDRASDSGHALYERLKDGEPTYLMLDLRYTDSAGRGDGVEITNFICEGWIEPLSSLAEPKTNPSSDLLSNAKTEEGTKGNSLPDGVATDAEMKAAYHNDWEKGIIFVRLIGYTQGAKWAQTYGRVPNKLEYDQIMESMSATDAIAATTGKPEEARINRRLVYQVRAAFEDGCRDTLKKLGPAF